MPILEKFICEYADGRPGITREEWVEMLSKEEQAQYRVAETRHHAHRQAAIDSGALVRSGNDYIWKDEHASKPDDPEWASFHHRYAKFCEDNGIILTSIRTEI
jgi:hypothetical protein